MSVIKGNPNNDFREQNPILSNIGMFSKVYKDHKQDIASKICWSMYMIEETDVNDNPIARIPDIEERIKEVKTSYYKDLDVESELYKNLRSDFEKFALDKEEYLYKVHVSKFEELTAHLNNLNLDVDKDFDKYIKIMEKLDKMWKGLEIIKDKMIEKKNKTNLRGNAQQSVREKRKK